MAWLRAGRAAIACLVACAAGGPVPALAQAEARFELGGQVTALRLSEFDTTDAGIGVQAGWRLSPAVAIDGGLTWFPGGDDGFPRVAEQQRVLGLVGVRAGVQRGLMEISVRARPGFLRFAARDDVACILIFPPPLECQVLSGRASFVTEIGGAVRVRLGDARRMYVSLDAGDLLVRYGSQSLRPSGEAVEDGFVSHNLMIGAGVGWLF